MKAAFVVDKNKVEIREIDKPTITPDEVLIRVRTVGVCGSDLHLYNGSHAFRRPPAILGHELSGEIAEVGTNVKNFKIGDRVTANPVISCGECPQCKLGLTGVCANKRVPGTPAWIGTFTEYFPIPAYLVYKLKDGVDLAQATLAEPMAVAEHILERVITQPRESLAILGCGSIGLLTLFLAKRRGYKKIICTDTVPASRDLAMKIGADAAIDPTEDGFYQKVWDMTGGQGVDVTVVAAGAPNILDQGSQITRKGGDVVLVSMITKIIPFDSYSYVFKEQRLIGAMVYTTRDFDAAVDIVNTGVDLSAFVTHRFPLEQTQEAMETLRQKNEGVVKVIVDVG